MWVIIRATGARWVFCRWSCSKQSLSFSISFSSSSNSASDVKLLTLGYFRPRRRCPAFMLTGLVTPPCSAWSCFEGKELWPEDRCLCTGSYSVSNSAEQDDLRGRVPVHRARHICPYWAAECCPTEVSGCHQRMLRDL